MGDTDDNLKQTNIHKITRLTTWSTLFWTLDSSRKKKLNKRWRKEWEIEEGEEHPKKGKKLLQSKGKRKRKKYLKQINKSASRIKATTINNRENIKEIE